MKSFTPLASQWNRPMLQRGIAFPRNRGDTLATTDVFMYDSELKIEPGQAKLPRELKP